MNRVLYGLLSPVSIKGNILSYRFCPVIRRSRLISSSIPSLECVIILCRVRRCSCIEAVLFFLCFYCRSALRVECDCTVRELECSVKDEACRHLVAACVRTCMRLVSIPTLPVCTFHRSRRNIACEIA